MSEKVQTLEEFIFEEEVVSFEDFEYKMLLCNSDDSIEEVEILPSVAIQN